eukprot:CAMPEP_0205999376 /NCGR_PEP_ID=MMETSP1464-20131121/811_1 /ASSEMBLY_ACC=CAM_ASM_001124 /TAXON_ID=119497 /ORGANISM="Exanthemachrysis gayraliae, Strain RCC1523" /LENGTH=58 /DNA_ID=CAMNT_0053372573 /DNA_START=75 /DNA_END=248 /DNA_ORIENTATION=+
MQALSLAPRARSGWPAGARAVRRRAQARHSAGGRKWLGGQQSPQYKGVRHVIRGAGGG